MSNPLTCLCAKCREALERAAAGKVVRIPKPQTPLEKRVREQYDAYTRVYGMSDAQAVREICQRFRLEGYKVTASQVRALL